MFNKLSKMFVAVLGGVIGYGAGWITEYMMNGYLEDVSKEWLIPLIYGVLIILFGIIFLLISGKIIKSVVKLAKKIEAQLNDTPMVVIIWGAVGLIIGLLIAFLISYLINTLIELQWVSGFVSAFIYFLLGYLGVNIASKRHGEINFFAALRKIGKDDESKEQKGTIPKILDTSVIIDGRIFDICQTGFIQGPLVIPTFVLDELRHIADSSDALKRNRGRRGLDILNKIQKELEIEVVINSTVIEGDNDVDTKLLKLTHMINGRVITNDYNLNKVAQFQGVYVLNINELANAVKPVVLPGEEMIVQVIKDGKETGQGVAYLDDGTMIVVDGGRRFVGKTIDVMVTSVLQTAAGRMIFAKPKAG